MSTQTIPLGQLQLDLENPRHGRMQSERDAVLALLARMGTKMVKIAEHIATYGLSPIDVCLVMRKGHNYVVFEGNRRLAALKLLHVPSLAKGTRYEKDFTRIAGKATILPEEVDCAIVSSREEAERWLEIRHIGEAEGVGVVRWGSLEQQRFRNRPGTQGGKGMAFIDTMTAAFPKNAALQSNLAKIAEKKLTTLGRVVSDPATRTRLALVEREGRYLSYFPAELLEDAVEQLAADIASRLSVSDLKTKAERVKYVKSLPAPEQDARRTEPQPLTLGTSGSLVRKRKAVKPAITKPEKIFLNLAFSHMGSRVTAVLKELRDLDLDRYPNAAAILCRVLLELAVDRLYEKKRWTPERELYKRVRKCIDDIDPSGKDAAYQAVRVGLSDGSSTYATRTLNAFVHNSHFHPSATEVRAFAANYERFLRELDARA